MKVNSGKQCVHLIRYLRDLGWDVNEYLVFLRMSHSLHVAAVPNDQ